MLRILNILNCSFMVFMAAIMFFSATNLAPTSADAQVNNKYVKDIGGKDTHLFDGSAKKIVVTSIDGVPIRLWDKTQSQEHKILCNPSCSKTILRYRGAGGPLDLRARTIDRKQTARVYIQVEEVRCTGPGESCSGYSISNAALEAAYDLLVSKGQSFDR